MEMTRVATYEDVIKTIADNYEEIEHSIANQLLLNVPNHYSTEGSYRETVWKSLFEMVIPRKYCIEQSVFIIDAYGHKSKEVDLAIFDELYTPYIFNYGEIKFIPIEAVAAVVQCKSGSLNKSNIVEWAGKIDKLITSLDSVVRMTGGMTDNSNIPDGKKVTQTATRPIKILCTLAGERTMHNYEEIFDIILAVDPEQKKLFKRISKETQSLENWNDSLNHAIESIEEQRDKKYREERKLPLKTEREHLLSDLKVPQGAEKDEENVILSLIFQLNQLLMVINNPMLFPHRAYAKRFSDILMGSRQSEGEEDEQQK